MWPVLKQESFVTHMSFYLDDLVSHVGQDSKNLRYLPNLKALSFYPKLEFVGL